MRKSCISKKFISFILCMVILVGTMCSVPMTAFAASYPAISALKISRIYQSDTSAASGMCYWASMATVQAYCLGTYTYGGVTTSYRTPGKDYNYVSESDAVSKKIRTYGSYANTAENLSSYPIKMTLITGCGNNASTYEKIYKQLKQGKPVIVYKTGGTTPHASIVIGYNGSSSSLEASGFTVLEIKKDGNWWSNSSSYYNSYANKPQTDSSSGSFMSCYVTLSSWISYGGGSITQICYPTNTIDESTSSDDDTTDNGNILSVTFNANGGSINSSDYKLVSDIVYNSDGSKKVQKWEYDVQKSEYGLCNASTFGLYKTGYTFYGWGTRASGGTVFDENDVTIKPSQINASVKNGNCSTTLYALWISDKYTLVNSITDLDTGRTYEYYTGRSTWETAKEFCESKGGYLATVTSQNEQNLINSLLDNSAIVWLGASDSTSEGSFKWVTGETFSYSNWNSNEPNDGDGYLKENYVELRSSTAKWNDVPNYTANNNGFILEREIGDYYLVNSVTDTSTGSIYEYYTGTTTWETANKICFSKGGYLATITSPEEEALIKSLLDDDSIVWLGATDSANEGIWEWITGEPFSYSNWNSGEPNDGSGYTKENYVELRSNTSKWNDVPNYTTNNNGFILEKVAENYTIIYDANGGVGAPSAQTKFHGSDVSLSSTLPTKTGYTFTSWNTETDGTGISYSPGEIYTSDSSVTLYAQWEQISSFERYCTYIIENGEVTIIDCDEDASGDIVIPSTIEGYPVTTIGDSAFYYCEKITSVTIPDGVKEIKQDAFHGCYSIQSVIIPNGVTSIENNTFCNCKSLIFINIPDSVTSIGNWAFYSTAITSITIPGSVTTIGENAFQDCANLECVTIANGVEHIGQWAFVDCDSITDITLPDSITNIDNCAFRYCDGLTNITIPRNVTNIGQLAFSSCKNLENIYVTNGNTNYSSVNGVLFNKNMTELIQYPVGNTRTSYTIPNSVITIKEAAFRFGNSLTNVTIGNKVTTISDEAFSCCSNLVDIVIPNSVTNIGDSAFYDDSNTISNVYYDGTESEWNLITIGDNNAPLLNATIHFNDSSDVAVTGIAITSEKYITLRKDNSLLIEAEVYPYNATNKNLKWSSSDESVATVDENGWVYAVSPGTAYITVVTEDGNHSDTCEVYIWESTTGVNILKDSIEMKKNESVFVDFEIYPESSTYYYYHWESSDDSVVTVDDEGNITAVGKGTATVTIEILTYDDTWLTDSVEVTVKGNSFIDILISIFMAPINFFLSLFK